MARPARRWRLGTRRSALALAQARQVAALLAASGALGTAEVELVGVTTGGDLAGARGPGSGGDPGAFVRELDAALTAGQVDLCVHSAKDVPPELAAGLALAAFPPRADPRDALVGPAGWTLAGMPRGARVGTASPRRALQLLALRPDLVVQPVRGNVDTRLARRDRGEVDALLLAVAGLERLGLAARVAVAVDPADIVPAAGQGALAVTVRADDRQAAGLLARLDDPPTAFAVGVERAVLAGLGGGCSVPTGVLCEVLEGRARVRGAIAGPRSGRVRRVAVEVGLPARVLADGDGRRAEAAALGQAVAAELLRGGGQELLAESREAPAAPAGGAAAHAP